MKRKLLLLSFMLFTFASYAQFEVRETNSDNLISDGQTINFSESGNSFSADYNWKFKVTNTSSEDIYMRIFVDEMVNSDGTSVQLCFAGVCLNSVSTGSGYPSTAAQIAPGATNIAGNSFWNQHPSGTATAMSWTLRFQAYDAVGTPTGTPVTVTYNYDPSLSIGESDIETVKIFPTQVKNELTVTANEDLMVEFYDVLGKRVKKAAVIPGESQIDVSKLSSQLYIVRFTNELGKTTIKKIVKE